MSLILWELEWTCFPSLHERICFCFLSSLHNDAWSIISFTDGHVPLQWTQLRHRAQLTKMFTLSRFHITDVVMLQATGYDLHALTQRNCGSESPHHAWTMCLALCRFQYTNINAWLMESGGSMPHSQGWKSVHTVPGLCALRCRLQYTNITNSMAYVTLRFNAAFTRVEISPYRAWTMCLALSLTIHKHN